MREVEMCGNLRAARCELTTRTTGSFVTFVSSHVGGPLDQGRMVAQFRLQKPIDWTMTVGRHSFVSR